MSDLDQEFNRFMENFAKKALGNLLGEVVKMLQSPSAMKECDEICEERIRRLRKEIAAFLRRALECKDEDCLRDYVSKLVEMLEAMS